MPKRKSKPCKHSIFMDWETGETVCSKCHMITDKIYVNESIKNPNSDILIWNRSYDKHRWVLDALDYLTGVHNDCFDDLVWMEVLNKIPNPCIWSQVYHVFHRYRITDYWLCFGFYVGLDIKITRTVLARVLKYSDLGYTKYRISFMYLFYKFTQMEDKNNNTDYAKNIPFKGTKNWIKKTDLWWKTICQQNHWPYINSKMVPITWDKDHIVQSLKIIVKNKDEQRTEQRQQI